LQRGEQPFEFLRIIQIWGDSAHLLIHLCQR
jgi:hypothetical protein